MPLKIAVLRRALVRFMRRLSKKKKSRPRRSAAVGIFSVAMKTKKKMIIITISCLACCNSMRLSKRRFRSGVRSWNPLSCFPNGVQGLLPHSYFPSGVQERYRLAYLPNGVRAYS